jgi:hypothetical protein
MSVPPNDAVYACSYDEALLRSFSSETQPALQDPLKLLQQQYKLKCLHHAWACQYPGVDTCPNFRHCCAAKRLYQHVIQCRQKAPSSSSDYKKCPVPCCRKMRRVWEHYKRCSIQDCVLCNTVPRYRMNVVVENGSPNPRPPLSPRQKMGSHVNPVLGWVSSSSITRKSPFECG